MDTFLGIGREGYRGAVGKSLLKETFLFLNASREF